MASNPFDYTDTYMPEKYRLPTAAKVGSGPSVGPLVPRVPQPPVRSALQGPGARRMAGEPVRPVNWYPSVGDVLNSDVTIRTGSAGEDWRALGGLRGAIRENKQNLGMAGRAVGGALADVGRTVWTGSSGPSPAIGPQAQVQTPSGVAPSAGVAPVVLADGTQDLPPPIGFTGPQFPNEAELGGKVVIGYDQEPQTPIITGAFARTPTGNRQYSPDEIEAIMRDPNAGRMESNIPGQVNQAEVDAAKWADYNERVAANYQRMQEGLGGSQLGVVRKAQPVIGPRERMRRDANDAALGIARENKDAALGVEERRGRNAIGVINAGRTNPQILRDGGAVAAIGADGRAVPVQEGADVVFDEAQQAWINRKTGQVTQKRQERAASREMSAFDSKNMDILANRIQNWDGERTDPEFIAMLEEINALKKKYEDGPVLGGGAQEQGQRRYTAEEAKKLPKGTVYIGTDGKTRKI